MYVTRTARSQSLLPRLRLINMELFSLVSQTQMVSTFVLFFCFFLPVQLLNVVTGNIIGTVAYVLPVIAIIIVMIRHSQLELDKQRRNLQARAKIDQIMRQVSI